MAGKSGVTGEDEAEELGVDHGESKLKVEDGLENIELQNEDARI